ncbi:hypothetical protein O1W69_01130 [Chlamydia sp. 12-01]|uniref:hypothetical protein n=1 Tax=Chlamydia sp. 12-01 TaxID=3002742 RepID=UPI0035D5138B
MKRIIVLFISLFLTPIGVEDSKETRSYEKKTWIEILRTHVREYEFPCQEVIEPLFCESFDSHVRRV